MSERFFGSMKIKIGIAEASPGPCFSLPVVEVLSSSEANAVSADQVGPVLAQVEEIPQRKGKLAGWSLVVMATRLDLGPSRGLTSSFAGRPGACPMRGASLRALAPGQAVSP